MAVRFLKDVEGEPIQPHRRDDWVWTADPSGQYSAQSAYNMLREVMGVGPSGAVHMHALSRQCLVFIDDDFAYALDRRNLNIK